MSRKPLLHLLALGMLLAACAQAIPDPAPGFDGFRALQSVEYQVGLGPRTPGSPAQSQALDWYQEQLLAAGWRVELQETEYEGQSLRNLVAKRGSGAPWYILGAHYDSRLQADRDPDPDLRTQPVPGANDGASGVAVLLEIARVLPENWPGTLWIVLFDGEDNGEIEGWDWIYGSRAFAESLEGQPDGMLLVDMVGDENLTIPLEGNSDVGMRNAIWRIADELGYGEIFLPEVKYTIIDDHLPFLERGIPAVDIIDLDYAYWHTTQDTADKVSAHSLQAVGDVLLEWLRRSLTMPEN